MPRTYTIDVAPSSSRAEPLDLSRLTRDQLIHTKLRIEAEASEIKGQLDEAKARVITDGTYADPTWFRRAQAALRAKGRACQAIQAQLSRLRRAEEAAHPTDLHRIFFAVARDQLSPEMFASIQREALHRFHAVGGFPPPALDAVTGEVRS